MTSSMISLGRDDAGGKGWRQNSESEITSHRWEYGTQYYFSTWLSSPLELRGSLEYNRCRAVSTTLYASQAKDRYRALKVGYRNRPGVSDLKGVAEVVMRVGERRYGFHGASFWWCGSILFLTSRSGFLGCCPVDLDLGIFHEMKPTSFDLETPRLLSAPHVFKAGLLTLLFCSISPHEQKKFMMDICFVGDWSWYWCCPEYQPKFGYCIHATDGHALSGDHFTSTASGCFDSTTTCYHTHHLRKGDIHTFNCYWNCFL